MIHIMYMCIYMYIYTRICNDHVYWELCPCSALRRSVSCLCVNWPQERALSGSADRSIQQLGGKSFGLAAACGVLIGGGWVEILGISWARVPLFYIISMSNPRFSSRKLGSCHHRPTNRHGAWFAPKGGACYWFFSLETSVYIMGFPLKSAYIWLYSLYTYIYTI